MKTKDLIVGEEYFATTRKQYLYGSVPTKGVTVVDNTQVWYYDSPYPRYGKFDRADYPDVEHTLPDGRIITLPAGFTTRKRSYPDSKGVLVSYMGKDSWRSEEPETLRYKLVPPQHIKGLLVDIAAQIKDNAERREAANRAANAEYARWQDAKHGIMEGFARHGIDLRERSYSRGFDLDEGTAIQLLALLDAVDHWTPASEAAE